MARIKTNAIQKTELLKRCGEKKNIPAVANSIPVPISTNGYCMEMGAEQFLHRPPIIK